MKIKIFLLLFMMIIFSLLFAQTAEIDSLRAEIENQSVPKKLIS